MFARSLLRSLAASTTTQSLCCSRSLSGSTQKIKKFYKNVSVDRNGLDKYEILLDSRKLKTPRGTEFYVPNETLANLIATEWDCQQKNIELSQMHLTTLAYTVIDNPNHLNVDAVVEKILTFIESDTVCFRMPEPEELAKLQAEVWDPVVQWFATRYQVNMPVTSSVMLPEIDPKTIDVLSRYFRSFNIWSLTGYLYAIENLKSLIIACALFNRQLSVENAVKISRVEEDFQTQRWGSVEYHHDLDLAALETRVAAAVTFALLNCEKTSVSQSRNKCEI